jgi:hypothetical protein
MAGVVLPGPVSAASTSSATVARTTRPPSWSRPRATAATDDGAAMQAAIDAAAAKPGGGLVFLPSGRYRISKTLFLWPGVRVFGVGATRPLIVLGDATPGFQKGLANMVIFAGAKRDPASRPVAFPPPGSVPFDKDVARRQSRHLLQRDEQHRLQDRQGQSGRDGDPLPRRPARLSQPYGLRHRLGPGGPLPRRQRGRGPALQGRALRHPGREDRRRPGASCCSTRPSRASATRRSASTRPA